LVFSFEWRKYSPHCWGEKYIFFNSTVIVRISACTWGCHVKATLIKKKTKFSSYLRKSRRERLQSHIWLTVSSYMTKYLRISSYMTLQPFPSEFPYIWGKFYFHFYQCSKQVYLLIIQRNNNHKTACVYITWSQSVTGVKHS